MRRNAPVGNSHLRSRGLLWLISLPVVVLPFCGYIAWQGGLIPHEGIPGITGGVAEAAESADVTEPPIQSSEPLALSSAPASEELNPFLEQPAAAVPEVPAPRHVDPQRPVTGRTRPIAQLELAQADTAPPPPRKVRPNPYRRRKFPQTGEPKATAVPQPPAKATDEAEFKFDPVAPVKPTAPATPADLSFDPVPAPAATDAPATAVPPPAASAPLADLPEVQRLLDAGDQLGAHQALSQIYWKQPAQRPAIQAQLDALAKTIYFSPQPHLREPYIVQPGDQLRKIAGKYQLSWQYLARLNAADPRKIRPGQKLKVFDGPFSAVVDLSDFELTVHCQGYFIRKYRVGIGRDGSTPVGEFKVKEKLEDPTYYGPNGDVKAHDDPLNPLGERWIDLGDSYGIHGTIDPQSIGRADSRGCIRLLNSDVEELYDLLVVGSAVRIQR